MLMRKDNVKAIWEIAQTWLWIAFAMALVGFFPNPFTIIVSLFILGGKQLACAIILHDCSHDSLFESRNMNQFFGNWFGAFPILHDVKKYRPYHIQHHLNTGLQDDPDLPLTQGYPTSIFSMTRKLLRDLFGLSGLKAIFAVVLMQLGFMKYALNGKAEWLDLKEKNFVEIASYAVKNISGPLAANLILFGILLAIGKPLLYLLWVGALLTTYNFSLRVRSMAEHSMVLDNKNPKLNTRTTYANFFERLLFAPHHVNFHSEHHLCMGVPSYHLPTMHKLLKERGYFIDGTLEDNYARILQLAVSG